MKKFLIPIIFWSLIGIFILIISVFFIPAVGELFEGSLLFLSPFIIFSLLGAILIFLTLKGKVEGMLKKFLMLTGVSSTEFFISIFLHNAFYALAMITSQIVVLKYLMEVLHITFFIIAIFICPLGFLIGAVGTAVLFVKKKRQSKITNSI